LAFEELSFAWLGGRMVLALLVVISWIVGAEIQPYDVNYNEQLVVEGPFTPVYRVGARHLGYVADSSSSNFVLLDFTKFKTANLVNADYVIAVANMTIRNRIFGEPIGAVDRLMIGSRAKDFARRHVSISAASRGSTTFTH
jgi:hypothetical protein